MVHAIDIIFSTIFAIIVIIATGDASTTFIVYAICWMGNEIRRAIQEK